MITAPSSNTGKTTLTLGIIRALSKRGMEISPFKTGPDYIDSKFLSWAAGRKSGNLDMHMMGRENLNVALGLNEGDFLVVEGAMGYYDGIYNSFENSTYDMAKSLGLASILVYSPKGEMFSAIPKIKGMVDFPGSTIKAIILNKTSRSTYIMMKEQIEAYTDLEVLGYLPLVEEFQIESRGLGLEDSNYKEEKYKLIEAVSLAIEECIDLDRVIELAGEVKLENLNLDNHGIRIGIARDEAFSFHYNENIKILEQVGRIEYFSPLNDPELGEYDLVFIGGGYPENHLKTLSENKSMQESIRAYVEKGGHLIGEAGGLMYLTTSINDYPMVGIIEGHSKTLDRLSRFGYVNIELEEDCILGKKGDRLVGNEYHKSEIDSKQSKIFNISKPKSKKVWTCGYKYKNMIGYYQHLNLLGNLDSLDYLLKRIIDKGDEL